MPIGEEPASQVITEFAPAPVRPPSYPAWLPFLPGRVVFTTESPSGAVSPGARWACDDPEAVVAAITEQSVAAGWTDAPLEQSVAHGPLAAVRVQFARGDRTRQLLVDQAEAPAIVQLLEVPTACLPTPPA